MKTHDHAAQLADCLQWAIRIIEETHLEGLDVFTEERLDDGRAALAAWDRHNAPAPEQLTLL